jgi:hypothetical protein
MSERASASKTRTTKNTSAAAERETGDLAAAEEKKMMEVRAMRAMLSAAKAAKARAVERARAPNAKAKKMRKLYDRAVANFYDAEVVVKEVAENAMNEAENAMDEAESAARAANEEVDNAEIALREIYFVDPWYVKYAKMVKDPNNEVPERLQTITADEEYKFQKRRWDRIFKLIKDAAAA